MNYSFLAILLLLCSAQQDTLNNVNVVAGFYKIQTLETSHDFNCLGYVVKNDCTGPCMWSDEHNQCVDSKDSSGGSGPKTKATNPLSGLSHLSYDGN